MSELLIGAGHNRDRRISLEGKQQEWTQLVTLDMNPDTKPDIVHDLEHFPYPIGDNFVDEIHAYEVLEHIGVQGDWRFFFRQFDEFARILKPNGLLFSTSPSSTSPWVWGDPGHTRYMGPEVFLFLDRSIYDQQIGKTAMTDYRSSFTSNWERVFIDDRNGTSIAIIKNLK
jgi:cyclopropane fatty-acyl-phospholipid synthase-like methyltransferase